MWERKGGERKSYTAFFCMLLVDNFILMSKIKGEGSLLGWD